MGARSMSRAGDETDETRRREELLDARRALAAVVEAVHAGELDAAAGRGRALLRHLEGAVIALDVILAEPSD